MLITQYDKCKKQITTYNEKIVLGTGWPQFSFCERWGKPISL
jgi:hypothetical protein